MQDTLNLFHVPTVDKSSSTTRKEEVRRILEALLFSVSEPLPLAKMQEILELAYPVTVRELRALLAEMQESYATEKRGFQLDEIGEGYLFRTPEECRPFLEHLHQDRRGEKLSKASLEVLAIIAYKQPITRAEIEKIRGVDCGGSMSTLLERDLITGVGRLDAPGRPMQYATTRRFLTHFGLKKIQELTVNE